MTFGEEERSVCSAVRPWPYGVRDYCGVARSMAFARDMDDGARDGLSASQWYKDEPAEIVQVVNVDSGVL